MGTMAKALTGTLILIGTPQVARHLLLESLLLLKEILNNRPKEILFLLMDTLMDMTKATLILTLMLIRMDIHMDILLRETPMDILMDTRMDTRMAMKEAAVALPL